MGRFLNPHLATFGPTKCRTMWWLTVAVMAALAGSCGGTPEGPRAPVKSPLESWEVWRTIGAVDSPESHVFGRIVDATIMADGSIAVLDGLGYDIRIIHPTGEVGQLLGIRGDGPGEFRDPVAVVRIGTDILAVPDRGQGTIHYFTTDPLALMNTVRTGVYPNDACSLAGVLFLLADHEDHSIHRVSETGGEVEPLIPVRRDGENRAAGLGLVAAHERTGGVLVCDEAHRALVHVPERLGIIASYGLDGTSRWESNLPGFVQPTRTPSAGGVRYDLNQELGYAHSVVGAAVIEGGILLVTVRESYRRDFGREPAYRGYVVRLSDGAILARLDDAPLVYSASNARRVSSDMGPYPRLRIWVRRD